MRNLFPPILVLMLAIALFVSLFKSIQVETTSNDVPELPVKPSETTGEATFEQDSTPSANDYAAQITESVSRPLFSESRTPRSLEAPEPPVPEPTVEELVAQLEDTDDPTPPSIQMRGYLETEKGSKALVFNPQLRNERWISVGQMIDDWKVQKILASQLIIQFGEFEHVVEIKR